MGKIFFLGDSITCGAWDKRGGWVNRLIGEIMTKTIRAGFAPGKFYCLPYNLGLSGDTVPTLTQRLAREVSPRLDADAVNESIQLAYAIGVNDTQYLLKEGRCHFSDAEFKANVNTLIHASRKITPHISFIGMLPVEENLVNPMPWASDKSYLNDHILRFEAIIGHACSENDLPFQPMFEDWRAMPDYHAHLIDGVHPNSKGHALMAEQLRGFIMNEAFYKLHSDG